MFDARVVHVCMVQSGAGDQPALKRPRSDGRRFQVAVGAKRLMIVARMDWKIQDLRVETERRMRK